MHELNHSHRSQVHENGYPVGLPKDGLEDWKTVGPPKASAKDQP